MTEIITYIQANWTVWLFGLVGAVLGYIIQKLRAQQKEDVYKRQIYERRGRKAK